MHLERDGFGSIKQVSDVPGGELYYPAIERVREDLRRTGALHEPLSEKEMRAMLRAWRAEANLPPLSRYEDTIEETIGEVVYEGIQPIQPSVPFETGVEVLISPESSLEHIAA